ncbi:MAG TPA: hypothetical protein VJ742_00680 [Nitrososphaera sp.]|nr:hypothetical protein [Nitrososphaera sp.]
MKHTPLPWKSYPTFHGGDGETVTGFWISSDSLTVGQVDPAAAMKPDEILANAAYIVQACNAFHDLVEALKAAIEFHHEPGHGNWLLPEHWEAMRAALKKAGG